MAQVQLKAPISVEMLNNYRQLKRMYPDALIIISDQGYAKALYENAIKVHDTIQDGTPIIYAQHPLSDCIRDRIAVYEIPHEQFDRDVQKLLKRYPSIAFAELED